MQHCLRAMCFDVEFEIIQSSYTCCIFFLIVVRKKRRENNKKKNCGYAHEGNREELQQHNNSNSFLFCFVGE